ncbi:MAG: adenine phosphoribosyltransferase [Sphaerochaeta sp.]|jgi:adenine phosphoribosyltransferase|nr:adenine phosphoribosyltransferase [Sphaerochaeta sp.]MCH3920423.1 adenine phosphoribosyltransferase [Sphaerochaeta sp.]MCI2045719.1 adenine phosphoribosyltransferase [Sphaerochaeta sp.]MCI2096570.1 adenine phosphoribosyltransferase [Sphaerochaeta sp.]MCI2105006.1 adenine phosphoribosyltransferase [Sphaerochaeta sp.]
MDSRLERIDKAIRKKADFPRKGILYNDISGLTVTPDAFGDCIDLMYEYAKERDIDRIAGIDARGFVLGAPLAYRMHLPLILVRKPGKLCGTVHQKTYQLEYGTDTICVQEEDVQRGDRILVCDDLIATGGTVLAACQLFEELGATVAGCFAIIGLSYLPYKEMLKAYPVHTLLEY